MPMSVYALEIIDENKLYISFALATLKRKLASTLLSIRQKKKLGHRRTFSIWVYM